MSSWTTQLWASATVADLAIAASEHVQSSGATAKKGSSVPFWSDKLTEADG